MKTDRLQTRLGYRFKDLGLLQQALTHRSHSTPHNERLEFLGDSILNFIIAAELYRRFTRLREGELSRLRASLVREQRLHDIAVRIELGDYLRLGEGELKSGGFRRPSILADSLEAVIGAVYLDGGFEAAQNVVMTLYQPLLDTLDPAVTADKDPKTLLQEWLQSRKHPLPQYNVIATHGAAHDQRFEVECLIPALGIRTVGSGTSRRLAEQEAARRAHEALNGA
ncbi:MAG: ribonuclease III [Burkholderiales bacterium]|uniref:ribonuclease III n=1 Tax=Caldimonas thermodepolymerans TaxID=215580 RepID=UPI000DB08C8A|nr:ribonuclease III [Burkholderiales bacterium]PZN04511.1 MAG: ribonuclease III [Pseudomonadota bacterium]